MNLRLLKKGDLFLIALIVLVSLSFLLTKAFSDPEDAKLSAVVMVDGKTVKRIEFSEMGNTLDYQVPCDGSVRLTASPEGVWFSHSDCPDQTCIRTGKLKKAGDTAACVPNRVIVIIEGAKDENIPDTITY